METSFVTAFVTVATGVGGGMALVSVLRVKKAIKGAVFAALIAVTMVLGTRFGLLQDLGSRSNFSGDPTGQVIGVLLGVMAVWLVFLRERPGALDQMPSR